MYPHDWPPPNEPMEHLEETVAVAFYAPAIEDYLLPSATSEQKAWADAFYVVEKKAFENLDSIVRQTLHDAPGADQLKGTPGLTHGYRRVPPRTGGAIGPHDVAVVLGFVNDVVQALGGYIALADLLVRLSKRGRIPMEVFADERDSPRDQAQQVFTVPALKALCYRDLWRSHGIPESAVSICRSETSRVIVAGTIIGSEKHPIGSERHRVELVTDDVTFIYITDTFGRAFEHYRLNRNKSQSLLLPNLLADD